MAAVHMDASAIFGNTLINEAEEKNTIYKIQTHTPF